MRYIEYTYLQAFTTLLRLIASSHYKLIFFQFHLDIVGFLSYTVRYYMRRRKIIDTHEHHKSLYFFLFSDFAEEKQHKELIQFLFFLLFAPE
jgi:hypothetical protein